MEVRYLLNERKTAWTRQRTTVDGAKLVPFASTNDKTKQPEGRPKKDSAGTPLLETVSSVTPTPGSRFGLPQPKPEVRVGVNPNPTHPSSLLRRLELELIRTLTQLRGSELDLNSNSKPGLQVGVGVNSNPKFQSAG